MILGKTTNNHSKLGVSVNPGRSRRTRLKKISDLDFVGNIVLLSDDFSASQALLSIVEAECERTGLHGNAKNTEYMAYCKQPGPTLGQ